MRLALIVVTMLSAACSRESIPPGIPSAPSPSTPPSPAPDPPAPAPAQPGALWAMVISPTGGCIDGATLQVIAGGAVVQSGTQTDDCSVWDYGGGFLFKSLTAGVDVTLRASAPGYIGKDQTATPETSVQRAVIIELRPAQLP